MYNASIAMHGRASRNGGPRDTKFSYFKIPSTNLILYFEVILILSLCTYSYLRFLVSKFTCF
eukprot:SAG31_NODE_34_length_31842_cov_31.677850_37_plen_62_part_00